MKTKILLLASIAIISFFISCKKDASKLQITFTNNIAEDTADANGEYILTGHISSAVSLNRVILTKQGQPDPFLIDESTAKNKNEYDYSYLITV